MMVAEYGGDVPVIIETAPQWSFADFVLEMLKSVRGFNQLQHDKITIAYE